MDCFNRWSFDTFRKLCGNDPIVHPRVIQWALHEFGRSGTQKWKALESRLLEHLKRIRGSSSIYDNTTDNGSQEYGIVGLPTSAMRTRRACTGSRRP